MQTKHSIFNAENLIQNKNSILKFILKLSNKAGGNGSDEPYVVYLKVECVCMSTDENSILKAWALLIRVCKYI